VAQPHHVDKVISTVNSPTAAAVSRLAASWRRSLVNHRLDPANECAPERIDEASLKLRLSAMEQFMTIAAPKLDHLFGLVGNSGCCVLLTGADGVILDQRSMAADANVFQDWGLWSGADWSEAAEGTNGIGTCLAEQRQVIIHRG
jgi:transcriptional regulator of acetoin/glycerol metabolism